MKTVAHLAPKVTFELRAKTEVSQGLRERGTIPENFANGRGTDRAPPQPRAHGVQGVPAPRRSPVVRAARST